MRRSGWVRRCGPVDIVGSGSLSDNQPRSEYIDEIGSRRPPRPLPHHLPAGPGRHGGRLPRRGRAPRPRGRPQGRAARVRARPRARRAFRARGARGGQAHPSKHRHGLRVRPGRRPALLHDGADAGRGPEGAHQGAPRRDAAGGGAGGGGGHGAGAGLRAPARLRAPRREAGEHPVRRGRRGAVDRLRDCAGDVVGHADDGDGE